MDNMDVICVGNASVDVFVLLENLKKFNYDKFSNSIAFPLGEKIPVDEHKFSLGGNACNLSVGLSRLKQKTSLVAEVGNDEFSEKIVNTLKKESVDLTYLKRDGKKIPYFNIVLAYGGDRTILSEKNPVDFPIEVGKVSAKYFYLTSFGGDWKDLYKNIISKNNGSLFALNPGSRQIREGLSDIINFLPNIEILFVNVGEAQKIAESNSPDIKDLLKSLKSFGVKIAIITDGINGSYAIDKNGDMFQTGVLSKEKPIERTGAGDSYATGFLWAILNGRPIGEAMRYGAINADSVIKKVGAQDGLLNQEEIEQKSKENPELTAVRI